jgi:hypothetical protein
MYISDDVSTNLSEKLLRYYLEFNLDHFQLQGKINDDSHYQTWITFTIEKTSVEMQADLLKMMKPRKKSFKTFLLFNKYKNNISSYYQTNVLTQKWKESEINVKNNIFLQSTFCFKSILEKTINLDLTLKL